MGEWVGSEEEVGHSGPYNYREVVFEYRSK